MSSGFPLVRASDVTPFIRWLRDNGRQIDGVLELAHLPVAPWEQPDRLIPLLGAFEIMQSISAQEGPDIASRVVSGAGVLELGELGAAMLAESTLRDALALLCTAINRHSSHEQFEFAPVSGGAIIREQINLDLDNETRHIIQQYVAALIRSLFPMTGFNGEPFGRMEMTPHPRFGLTHLENTFRVSPVPTTSGRLSILISNELLDRPFLTQFRKGNSSDRSGGQAQLSGMTLKSSATIFIATMLEEGEGEPSLSQFAAASGFSRRAMQRMFAEEGTSFSTLVDDVRRVRAIEELEKASTPIGAIAADLGYSGQQAFVRAVRRWTGRSPREFRRLTTL